MSETLLNMLVTFAGAAMTLGWLLALGLPLLVVAALVWWLTRRSLSDAGRVVAVSLVVAVGIAPSVSSHALMNLYIHALSGGPVGLVDLASVAATWLAALVVGFLLLALHRHSTRARLPVGRGIANDA